MASAGVAMAKARAAKAINLIVSSLPVSMHGFVATNKKPRDNRGLHRPVYLEGHLLSERLVLGFNAGSRGFVPGYVLAEAAQCPMAKILRTSEMVHASLEVWLYPLSTGKSKSRDRRLVDARVFEKGEQV